MPKLLSWEETKKIATQMCAEYGLPAPELWIRKHAYSPHNRLVIQVNKRLPSWKLFGKQLYKSLEIFRTEEDPYCLGFEAVLTQLSKELESRLLRRAKTAEELRSKYAMQEADEFLEEELRKSEP